MRCYGVIMAGGCGTRFWPLSRKKKPKQLLNLTGKDILVNETIQRMNYTINSGDIYIVTNRNQVNSMMQATNGKIPRENFLEEPMSRNTSACIGYAAIYLYKKYGDGIMVITPSDAYIQDQNKFTMSLQDAISIVEEKNCLATIGITPTFPATGYGYIHYDKSENGISKTVLEFREKPNYEIAKEYIESGEYLWNSGIFIWRISKIIECFKEYLPLLFEQLQKMYDVIGNEKEKELISEIYSEMQSISIDYGVMEKVSGVRVVPGEFGWNDIGSWDMLGSIHGLDEKGNVIIGDQINIDTKNTVSYSSGKLIATLGVSNLIIVETQDAVLVCNKEKAQYVKGIVEALQEKNRAELL